MVYAAILAGGVGKRMNGGKLPKQFLPLGNLSILEYSTLCFLENPSVDKVFVAVPKEWITYTEDLLLGKGGMSGTRAGVAIVQGGANAEASSESGEHRVSGVCTGVAIVQGGVDRNSSLMAVVNKINELYGIKNDDIIITHDAVRPFVTRQIIDENIETCRKYGAAATAIILSDTPIISDDGETIVDIPVRSSYYAAQTPQTFNMHLLQEVYVSLSDEEKELLTDAGKMFVLRNKKVGLVNGASFNIKITTPFDYTIACAYISNK